jgi:hypothetical protein
VSTTPADLTLQQLQDAAIRGQAAVLSAPASTAVHALQAQAWLQGVEALARFLQDPQDVPSRQMRMFLAIAERSAAVFQEGDPE